MKKLFLDTNVLLDILQKREPHYQSSSELLSQIARGKHKGFASVLTFSSIYYTLCRDMSAKDAVRNIHKISTFVEMLTVSAEMGKKALSSEITDYEDALQYLCAKANRADYIVTRNKKDFIKSEVEVASPQEILDIGL
jgi:predicted nucleic acid-binding protein